MHIKRLYELFQSSFDLVGIIHTKRYLNEIKAMGREVPHVDYPTMVVLGLAYPMRILKHSNTHLVSSFYTHGSDYHTVLKERIHHVMKEIPYPYELGVDNHPHNERLAASLAGLGFFGKNQLMINNKLGSYFFLGIVFIDMNLEQEMTLFVDDDCGDCQICIQNCPTHALDHGYDMNLCMSYYNQAKRVITDDEMHANYLLFGCDICQRVCPKNVKKGTIIHPEFELSGKEMVSIMDLFTLSEKQFRENYQGMSYLWKGKTVLMRNTLMLLLKHKNTGYIHEIEETLVKYHAPWYQDTAKRVLKALKDLDEKGLMVKL
jgi:epoxyqueuosine reductase